MPFRMQPHGTPAVRHVRHLSSHSRHAAVVLPYSACMGDGFLPHGCGFIRGGIVSAATVITALSSRHRGNWKRNSAMRRSIDDERTSKATCHPNKDEADFLKEVLRNNKHLIVLQKIGEDTLQTLAESMQETKISAGEVLVQEGQPSAVMYVVAKGEVEIVKTLDGKPVSRIASRGEYVGAVTLLGNSPQKVTAAAKTDCALWQLNRDVFDSIVFPPEGQTVIEEEEEDDDDDDDDDGEVCQASSVMEIFVVSDSTAESASASVNTALRQFDYCFGTSCGTSKSTVYRFVRSTAEVKEIAQLAAKRKALVVFTVMNSALHDALTSACAAEGVESCDLWGSLLGALERKFQAKRSGVSGRRQMITDDYMQVVKAIEYTRKVDDGILPHLWEECDIMLVGPSRAGKTPLAFYLAQRGFKVANYPIVPDEEPPKELLEMDQTKCFGLLIKPERLSAIRAERMAQFGRKSTTYASLAAVKKELSWIKTFYLRRGHWPIIDTTNSGVVETASRILEIIDRRKGDSLAAASPLLS